MSVSKKWISNPKNVGAAAAAYLSEPKPTLREVADKLGTHYHNVAHAVRVALTPELFKKEQALRYSRSKIGEKNPMKGKTGESHHNYIGVRNRGEYKITTRPQWLENNSTQTWCYEHQKLVCEALGIQKIPEGWHVHHIDENPLNNSVDNLALVTSRGHRKLHRKSPYRKLRLWESYRLGTSK